MLWILALGHVWSRWHVRAHVAAWSHALVVVWSILWEAEHGWLLWACSLWTKRRKGHSRLSYVNTTEHLLRCFHGLEVSSSILVNIWVCFFKENLLVDDSLHVWHVRSWPLLHDLVFVASLEVHLSHAWHSSASHQRSLLKHQGSLLVLWRCRLWS